MLDQRVAFSKRLSEILPNLRIDQGRGRQTALGKLFGVSQQAARQWLHAETMPDEETIYEMSRRARVSYEWLRWGRGPKLETTRPKLKDLLTAAEDLKDYQIDQLIKIVPALEEQRDDDHSSPKDERRQGKR